MAEAEAEALLDGDEAPDDDPPEGTSCTTGRETEGVPVDGAGCEGRGAGVGAEGCAGSGAGVSKPGGRIDSGAFCATASADVSASAVPIPR